MISSADFTVSLLGAVGRFSTANRTSGGASTAGRGEADGIVSGRSHVRQRAVFMSATGQLRGRLRAVSRVRCHVPSVDHAGAWGMFRSHLPPVGRVCFSGAPELSAFSPVPSSFFNALARRGVTGPLAAAVAAVLIATVGLVTVAPAQAAVPGKARAAAPAGPLSAPDVVSAIASARQRKVKVEVLGEASAQTTTWANPNGTLTTDSYAAPIRFRRGGQWVDVETTLQAGADGTVAPKAHANGLKLTGGGKDVTLAAEGAGNHQVSVGWQGSLPKPSLKGDTATYKDVTPGADVTVQATRTGFEENVVLKSPPAAGYTVTIPVSATGLKAKQSKDGSVIFTDAAGKPAGTIPAPVMWDATVDAKSLEHPHRAPVKMAMVQSGNTVNLTLTPDAKFLADPATTYPVTVDPSASLSTVLDTFAQISYTTTQYASTDLKLGTYNSGADKARSFLQFPVQQLVNTNIVSSSLNLYEYWSGNCVQSSWELWQTGAADTSTVWTNQPAWTTKYASTTQTKGYPASCGGSITPGWVSVDPTSFLQYAGDHGYTYASMGLRATTETDSNSWKRFYSANNSTNVPYLSVTYNSYPMATSPTVAPGVSSVSGTTTTLYSNTATPQLQAAVTNADGGKVMAQWNVYDTTGGGNTQVLANLNGSWTASGGLSSASVPAGKLLDGHTYTAWPWGYSGSLWSRQTVPSGLVFTVDTTKPNAPTVASTDYPAGSWAKGAGQSGVFTITPAPGGTDTAGVIWQLDSGAQTAVATTGPAAAVTATPATDGQHTLTVASRDLAGNLSAPTVYTFNAGSGAVTSPTPGARTARRATLTAAAPSSTWQSVKFQYRRSDADGWADIPAANVTSGGTTLAQWPVAVTNGGSAPLVWDVPTTLGDDGSVQIRAEFTDTSLVSHDSSAVKITLDRVASQGAAIKVGPGSLNYSTGNFTLDGVDASAFGISIGRSLDSRSPQGSTPAGQVAAFGPGWAMTGVASTTLTDYTEIRTVTSTAVQVVGSGGSQISFTKNIDGSWSPEPGAEDDSLSYNSTADSFTLADTAGNVTVFSKSATTAGVWAITSTSPSGSGGANRFRFDSVTTGSTTSMRLARVAAPTSAIVDLTGSCLTPATPAVACRVLDLGYAAATTATGITSGTFGDYAAQINKITQWATDPATGTEIGTPVAQYAYDSNGVLRQVWDPRVTPNLVTSYAYDAAGHVTAVTPAGQLPWTLTYGTAGTGGDTNPGRLLNVSRPTLTPGSASQTNGTATTTVVYDVPLTTATGGPNAMGASDVAGWAQADAPTDATAIFPADQVPVSNTGRGNLTSGSYARATIHYLDVNGAETNTAAPGGHLSTTDFDNVGRIVRELSAGDRELALAASTNNELNVLGLASMTTAQRAALLSTQKVYDSVGQRLNDVYGPLHQVTLEHALAASGTSAALLAGAVVAARTHTHNSYDQGRPTDGSAKVSDMVTTEVTGSAIAGYSTEADTRTSTKGYDWNLGKAIWDTTDPAGLAITTATGYNAAGDVISSSQPSSTGSDAGTTLTSYYTATGVAPCGGHPEWADLVCQSAPAGAITGGGSNPTQRATTTTTYTMYGTPATVTVAANGSTRTTATTYDAVGRTATVAVSGLGATVQTTTTSYDAANGLPTATTTPDGARLGTAYDQLGRVLTSTDADGNTATIQYDNLNRPTQTSDSAPSSTTYTYDTSKDPRGLVTSQTDSNAGTFSAVYDADGNLTSESLPGSITLNVTTDETSQTTSRVYTDTSGNVLVSDQAGFSGAGLKTSRSLSTSGGLGVSNTYGYDAANRLSNVNQTVLNRSSTGVTSSTCTTRQYALDPNSNRTGLTTALGAANAPCSTSGGTSVNHVYDTADRLADTGYTYDAQGRVTAKPNSTTTSYYANDLAYQQSSGNNRNTWQLDPGDRIRSYTAQTNNAGTWTQTASRTNHYDGSSDSPAWTVEDTVSGHYTRNIHDIGGDLSTIYSSGNGDVILQLTDLHGDVIMALPTNDLNTPVVVMAADEFGNAIAGTGSARYDWLGGKQRSAETPSGDLLMGVRLYDPTTGGFLSTDPVPGGSPNAYAYPTDPINQFDLTGQCWSGWGWACKQAHRVQKHWRGILEIATIATCIIGSLLGCLVVTLVAGGIRAAADVKGPRHLSVSRAARNFGVTALSAGFGYGLGRAALPIVGKMGRPARWAFNAYFGAADEARVGCSFARRREC